MKALVPSPVRRAWLRMRIAHLRRRNRRLPLREIFTRIYQDRAWGGEPGRYCSGAGSSERHAAVYAEAIVRFIAERGIRTVVDLGCGDFVVGRRIQSPEVAYIGVDVVEGLIQRNRQMYGGRNVSFVCLDITSDELPDGDLCLLRQVLQHLSNGEIAAVLDRIRKYRYAIITEHYPAPSVRWVPNKDKPHGADTRIYDGSAVCLDQPPFSIPNLRVLLEDAAVTNLMHEGETLKTFLIEAAPPRGAT